MDLFPVYPLLDITPVRAEGCWLWDDKDTKYLDFYGGHAVISIGHTHPHYVKRIEDQLHKLGFYSNAVKIPIQQELAQKLGQLSGYEDYQLFLCNSGAEANENALKLASFFTKKAKILTVGGAFHGRTSLAVAATDNKKIVAPVNETEHIVRVPFGDLIALDAEFDEEVAAVIIEGIQGVGGIYEPNSHYFKRLANLCEEHGSLLILDEVQSGYGRTGKFFAHQHHGVQPDIITIAKGMGNGFPIGGVLINPGIEAWPGMLGTTFGGNPLACAAGLAVLEVIEQEGLLENAEQIGNKLINALKSMDGLDDVRGRGLMIGVDLPGPAASFRKTLLNEHHIFTGSAATPNTVRLLPPLGIGEAEADLFLESFQKVLTTQSVAS